MLTSSAWSLKLWPTTTVMVPEESGRPGDRSTYLGDFRRTTAASWTPAPGVGVAVAVGDVVGAGEVVGVADTVTVGVDAGVAFGVAVAFAVAGGDAVAGRGGV